MSTMQGFISVRHKEEGNTQLSLCYMLVPNIFIIGVIIYYIINFYFIGSWFIQEFCNILQSGRNKITFLEAIRKTIHSVMKKKGKLNETNSIAQLPELKTCRLLTDFQLPDYQEHI